MTVVCSGDELILDQITKQLEKLVDVLHIKVLKSGNRVNRELILIKIKADAKMRKDIIQIVNVFRANIVDISKDSLIVELTGGQNKLDAFIELIDGYEILELARTGMTGLSRGMNDVYYLE